ncbi:thaumatin-like protein 1 [Cryptomeria japonica]|uniref:thaumatin-like protein 1 n=1 Tax=Cryptomeria japonica TaxID=3369 RepID=UPI0027D9E0B2|nr:thaumatin-like protein 1 [Cryptomeria japonica]XP_057861290.2 thaumatin-like protein 1 [Cryptomeria japonica]
MPIKLELRVIILLVVTLGAYATSFTILNSCGYPVRPVFLPNAGIGPMATRDFELPPGAVRVVETPVGWSGSVLGRTGCNSGANGKDNCSIADYGGQPRPCNAADFIPLPMLAEFTPADLVNGYHLPMVVVATRGTGAYMAEGRIVYINLSNANDKVLACGGECEAFGSTQYCCIEAYANHNMSKPSANSQLFKNSTLTCADAYLAVTFCPLVGMDSQMSSTSSPLATSPTANGAPDSTGNGDPRPIIGGSKLSTSSTASAGSSNANQICLVPFSMIFSVSILLVWRSVWFWI